MDIYEIAAQTGASLSLLRRIEKLGALRLTESSEPLASELRLWLKKQNPLSVMHLVALIEKPAILDLLASYKPAAQAQIAALGKAMDEAAPMHIVGQIEAAMLREPAAVDALATWMRSVIPARAVTHHYLAVRLILGAKPAFRENIAARIHLAFLNARNADCLAGWWYVEGKRGARKTFYRAPKIHDL